MAPRRASDEHLELFAKIRRQWFVRRCVRPKLRGKGRFDISQAAVQEFFRAYALVLAAEGAEPLSGAIGRILPPDRPWTANGIQGVFDAFGLHFETLFWKLYGDLRKLEADGSLVALPWDFIFRNLEETMSAGRARARDSLMWNAVPVADVHDAHNPLVWMYKRVPDGVQLLKDLIAEGLDAVGVPRRVLTCGAQARNDLTDARKKGLWAGLPDTAIHSRAVHPTFATSKGMFQFCGKRKIDLFIEAFVHMGGRAPPKAGEDRYKYCRLAFNRTDGHTPTAEEVAEAKLEEDAKAAAKDAERKRKEETEAAAKATKEATKAAAKATKEATKAAEAAAKATKEATKAAAKATKEATKAAEAAAKAAAKIYLPAGTTCACGKKLENKVTVGVKMMNNKSPTINFACPHQGCGRVGLTTAADRAKVLQTVPNNGGAHLEEALMMRLRLMVKHHNQAGKVKDGAAFTDVVIRDDIITAEGNKGRPRGTKHVYGRENGGALVQRVKLMRNGKLYRGTFKTMEEAVEWRDAILKEIPEKRRRRI